MEHLESEQATCTGNGNVEFWHCKSCNKDFADESGSTEIKDVTVSAFGHFAVPKSDENKHWQECKYCSAVLAEGPHSATAYMKNKTGQFTPMRSTKQRRDRCGLRKYYAFNSET